MSDKGSFFTQDIGEVFKELTNTEKYRNCLFAATNMQFDLLGIFRHTKFESEIAILERTGHHFLYEFYVKGGKPIHPAKLSREEKRKLKDTRVRIIDTLNYAAVSVEELGVNVDIKKLPAPRCFQRKPNNHDELQELKKYNINDSLITKTFVEKLYKYFIMLGIKPRVTIASTSMDDFKRNHLKTLLKRMSLDRLDFAFKSYRGAFTGVYKRGSYFSDKEPLIYHDFNSMYPSVMCDALLPHPNYMRMVTNNNVHAIMNYEGCSDVDVYCPLISFPLLIHKTGGKNIFGVGNFRGVYTHIELRRALELGYVIKKVYASLYSMTTIKPFGYIKNYYELRKKYKAEGNSVMQITLKLLMNSIYGKWGQKYENKKVLVHKENMTEEDIPSIVDKCYDYYYVEKTFKPKVFCNPLWASYITALSRLKIHGFLLTHDPYYTDTDSIICNHVIHDSNQLGMLKIEKSSNTALICRLKMYMFKDQVVLKGLPKNILKNDVEIKLNPTIFKDICADIPVNYNKFTKFRESVKMNIRQNSLRKVSKHFSIEDDTRSWPRPFNINDFQESEPLAIENGEVYNIFSDKYRDEILLYRSDEEKLQMSKIYKKHGLDLNVSTLECRDIKTGKVFHRKFNL